MSVDVRRMVETTATSLMTGQMLSLEAEYQQKSAFTLGTFLLFAAQEWDRAAERLVEENAALREIFREAAGVVSDPALAERARAAADGADPGLRVSALMAANDDLRALLIDVHAHVEERSDAEARALDEAIWAELVRSTERRALEGSPF